jgi:exopolysaccharide biosynthesis predicted pyruvyltransferase EpsI
MTEMQSETVPPLGSIVQRRLAEIPAFTQAQHCALLNYPSHGNVGDHLIWVAQVHYLERVRQISVDYIAAPDRYCSRALEHAIGDQPIVLSGGGQLGDTWLWLQEFIERVILRHRRNPLIILPQSIHFRDPARLQQASAILQGHPNLTLVLRDQTSFQLAQDHFGGCRLILAPDMAFALPVGELAPQSQGFPPPALRRPWLVLRRRDREGISSNWERTLSPWSDRSDITDWLPLERRWIWGDRRLPLSRFVAGRVREILQRRLLMPRVAIKRHRWHRGLASHWQAVSRTSPLTRLSLDMVFEACWQMDGRQLVITDRLHGVICASILGVPCIAIDNRIGKLHNFLNTWSPWLPLAHAATPEQLPALLERVATRGIGPTAVH